MRKFFILTLFIWLVIAGCSDSTDITASDSDGDFDADIADNDSVEAEISEDGDADREEFGQETDEVESETESDEWEFDRNNYDLVNGWILLDSNPQAVVDSIETAATFGVNHIQLSHDIIMNIDEILGDGEDAATRVETLNLGIEKAHEHGMKAYIWAHEFSDAGPGICFSPEDPVWEERASAYREGLAKIPDVDGVIFMFGSAPLPPWFALCSCDWCKNNYPESAPWEAPPSDVRITMTIEKIASVIVNELGKELFIRTFVHEPEELIWHAQGLSSAQGVAFTGMHKGPVQDWQPYNPHHSDIGNIGNHPSVMELDVAGEYYGISELPFCAPGYYWYRLQHLWKNKGIGTVIRIQRGSATALGTPNEINIQAINTLIHDMATPLESIWDTFIEEKYGLTANNPSQNTFKQILKDTFPIRRKSHYVLGIWAMEKGSDIPTDLTLDQFNDRGEMPKWDADWTDIWNALDKPDKQTVLHIWQEASEAVELAQDSIASFAAIRDDLSPTDSADIEKRLQHQFFGARAFRAIKMFIWSSRAKGLTPDDPELANWMAWARSELYSVRTEMTYAGLESVSLVNPSRIASFLNNTTDPAGATNAIPNKLHFSPIHISQTTATSATLTFSASQPTSVILDYGLEIPDYGQTVQAEVQEADTPIEVTLSDLQSGQRYVVRLRSELDGKTYLGGDYWIYTVVE